MAKTPLVLKKPTISDVAKLAKVGKTSVSRYLNGEFDILSDSIKTHIEAAIKALDYRPNNDVNSFWFNSNLRVRVGSQTT